MSRTYFKWIQLLALVCLGIIALFMWNEYPREPVAKAPVLPRPFSPFSSYLSAVGIVEASSGNIFIGSPVNRIVDKIEVVVGQKVKEGDVLFRLEAHDLEADLAARKFELGNAVANLKKLEALPRAEDVAIATAQLNMAKTLLDQASSESTRVQGLQNSGAMSGEEVSRRRFKLQEAQGKYQQVEADLKKISAGAWKPDLEIARLQVSQAEALVARVQSDLERTIIRAPLNATILQIKIHPGEFPPSDSLQSPAMVIGNTDTLNLRVSINQFDASYYDSSEPAIAFLQGNAHIEFPLTFLHIEPFFVTKQNLSNEISEKVDTRVLQAIYCFEEGESRVFVGQQMDVFIETKSSVPKE